MTEKESVRGKLLYAGQFNVSPRPNKKVNAWYKNSPYHNNSKNRNTKEKESSE